MRERERERERELLIVCPYVVLYGIMVYFTVFSPWCADDFGYWPGPEFSPATILKAEWQHYFHWNGRSVAHLIVRGVLLSNQWAHCLLTPLVFIGILFIGQILLWGQSWRERALWWHPVLLFMFFWLFIPNFGQAIFWRTGAGNYCWTSFFALLFLIPFRFLLDNPSLRLKKGQTLLLAVLGLCAGWSNENVGIVVFLASAASIIHARRHSGQWPLWAVACCGMSLAGWLLLILAPGNYLRLQVSSNYREPSTVKKLLTYCSFWSKAQYRFLPLYIIIVLGMLHWKKNGKKSFFIALSLFIMAQLTLGAFILSGFPARRALTMTSMLLCISAAFFLYEAVFSIRIRNICIFAVFLFGISSFVMFTLHFHRQISIIQKRESLLASSSAPIIPPYIHTNSRHFHPETLNDFDVSWVKESAINYYKLKDITIENQDVDEEITYTVDGEKLIFKQNKNHTISISISIENSQKTNKKYKIYYIPYITSHEKLLNFSLISLYELFNIHLHERYPVFYKLYQTETINPGKGMNIATIHNKLSDIRYISCENTDTKERVFVRCVVPPEKK